MWITESELMMDLSALIRDVEDYPKPGILFRDITPLLANGAAMREVTKAFADYAVAMKAEAIAGIEARGFIFAPAVAAQLGLPFIPVRKEGKLPYECVTHSYDLEYGSDTLQIHTDALHEGQRVVIVDDLIADKQDPVPSIQHGPWGKDGKARRDVAYARNAAG